MNSSFVEVAFPIPLNRGFHYRISSSGSNGAYHGLGARVLAPFGKNKKLVGYVVGSTNETPSFPTKEITAWLDPEPFINETLLDLARWVSERYLCSLGEALACIVPPHLAPPKREKEQEDRRGAQLPALPQFSHSAQAPRLSVVCALSNDNPMATVGGPIVLSAEQKNVLLEITAAVGAKVFHPFLLRGITDSGKTEIYARAIDEVLAQGRQALFLLPEIALTPPFIEKLKSRYPRHGVALWHSGVSPNERYRIWNGIRSGGVQILLGARSAVFAPFPNLGIIVIDEEHEPSYKQEDRPRYQTRDVAFKRAEQTQSVLLMGSATPSLESYWKAKQGIYTLLELTSRVEERQLPPVTLIDQRPPVKEPGAPPRRGVFQSVFSEPLKLAIEQRLARREQVMLFVNRRGYTPFLRCSTCGWVARCSRCSTTLALHIKEEILKAAPELAGRPPVPNEGLLQCHACLHREPIPTQCPACKGMRLRNFGIGTQRAEQEVKKLFPFVKTARLDRDIASSRKAYEHAYHAFASGEVDVLIGTQMIAKGFDFPSVTLVGVVDADVSLHLPDFRSAERTFQLIAQVAGRTGRGEASGRVLVQTHHPDHYALQAAQAHDYLGFYGQEIRHRESLCYPPFCRLINIVIRAGKEPVAQEAAESLFRKLETLTPKIDILGPAPAPYSRIRNQFRVQILLKGTDATLEAYLSFLRHYRSPKGFMTVDVDPSDLL